MSGAELSSLFRIGLALGAMANAVAMAGVCGASLQGSLVAGSNVLNGSTSRVAVCAARPTVVVARAEQSEDATALQSRRSMLSLLAATVAGMALVKEARAAATSINIDTRPPAPFGGLRE